ncbi:hypothetical protein TNCV_3005801 [Trichonephila clavipes]|nr:hypothetical protein TNCV_3005801 [Trichonephila clavipes]
MAKVEFLDSAELLQDDWSNQWDEGGVALVLRQGESVVEIWLGHGTGGEEHFLEPPAILVSTATTHKTFAPTHLTSTYSVCTERASDPGLPVCSPMLYPSDTQPVTRGPHVT